MSEHISAPDFVRMAKKPGNKFGAKRVVLDGITFHSKAEAKFYAELKVREKAGEITDVELQPRFPLQVGDHGEVIGVYKADFRFWDNIENRRRVVDIKGVATREFRRTVKHVLAQYGIKIEVIHK
jgi:hypothetical protein